jgi:type IV secretion system protein VirB6
VGFFAEFNAWLNAILSTYIATNTALIASTLEPAVVTVATLYVMGWGYLQLTGQMQEPVLSALKRFAMIALVFGVGIHLWLYNTVVVDTFFNAPTELASSVIGAYNPVNIVDQIIYSGDDTANLLLTKGGIFNGNFSYYLAGIAVYVIVGLTAIYTIFLLTLSRIALSVLLALGPLFIALLLFKSTRRFCEAWTAQLTNYALVAILTVLVAALMLTVLTTAAQQAASAGGGIQIVHAVRVCMAAGLTFLVMRQVMPIAAGLASGIALSTFGMVSFAANRGVGGLFRHTGQFARGAIMDGETTRWDSLARKAGFHMTRGLAAGPGRLAQFVRRNTIRPS